MDREKTKRPSKLERYPNERINASLRLSTDRIESDSKTQKTKPPLASSEFIAPRGHGNNHRIE